MHFSSGMEGRRHRELLLRGSCNWPPPSCGDVATASASVKNQDTCAMPFLPSTSVYGITWDGDDAESCWCWSCGTLRYQQQQLAFLNRDLTALSAGLKRNVPGFLLEGVMTRGAFGTTQDGSICSCKRMVWVDILLQSALSPSSSPTLSLPFDTPANAIQRWYENHLVPCFS
jgi:hypothetical protein